MGIRCLFGHDFGGREVERDRREDGDEVVVAYRTVETCERCGSRRVVSENKEIKPLESGRDEGDREPTGAESGPEPATPEAGPEQTGAEAGSASAGPSAASAPPETERRPDPDPQTAETDDATTVAAPAGGTADASEDAAIIIDDAPPEPGDAGAESADRDADDAGPAADTDGASTPGQTPDLDAAVASEPETELLGGADAGSTAGEGTPADDPAAWPDAGAEDDGFDAGSPTAGGPTVSTDADGSPAPWPEESGVERDRNGTKFVRPEAETPDRDADTEFRCPNCGATRPSSASSLRSGDVCPECRKGYLAERPVER